MPTSAKASARKRVLIVQRSLSPPGGGNAVAAWMVHALAGVHDVATVTASAWSAAETNAFYGTSHSRRPGHETRGARAVAMALGPARRSPTRLRWCSGLRRRARSPPTTIC